MFQKTSSFQKHQVSSHAWLCLISSNLSRPRPTPSVRRRWLFVWPDLPAACGSCGPQSRIPCKNLAVEARSSTQKNPNPNLQSLGAKMAKRHGDFFNPKMLYIYIYGTYTSRTETELPISLPPPESLECWSHSWAAEAAWPVPAPGKPGQKQPVPFNAARPVERSESRSPGRCSYLMVNSLHLLQYSFWGSCFLSARSLIDVSSF